MSITFFRGSLYQFLVEFSLLSMTIYPIIGFFLSGYHEFIKSKAMIRKLYGESKSRVKK